MIHGGNIRIKPSWLLGVTIDVDIKWDDSKLSVATPTGDWWGPFAELGGFGTTIGTWEWIKNLSELLLWVPHPVDAPAARLIASVNQFSFPLTTGMGGVGELNISTPTVSRPPFTWEGFAT